METTEMSDSVQTFAVEFCRTLYCFLPLKAA